MKSPLIKLVQMAILPSPPLELPKFDGAPRSDPVSHIDAYAIACVEYLPYDNIMLKIFLRTLIGEALKWFYRLLEEYISTFQHMVDLFIQYFNEVNPYDTGLKYLLEIKQANDESNFDFIRRFRSLFHSYKTPFYGR